MWIRVLFFSDLLLAAVRRLRPLGGATESGAIVAEVTGGIHLVLQAITQKETLKQVNHTEMGKVCIHTNSWENNI